MALRNSEGRTKEAHHLGKRQIGALGVEPRSEVAHEGVFGRIHALLEPHARDLQSALDPGARWRRNVRILAAPHQQQPASDIAGLLQ